jgi:hypothetical protein
VVSGVGIACVILFAIAYLFQRAGPTPPPTWMTAIGSRWDFRLTKSQTLITGTFNQPDVDRRRIRTIDIFGFSRQGTFHQLLLAIPHWFPLALSMIAGYWTPTILSIARTMAARISLRFSLHTLLIATTLVAVGLGIIVWLTR